MENASAILPLLLLILRPANAPIDGKARIFPLCPCPGPCPISPLKDLWNEAGDAFNLGEKLEDDGGEWLLEGNPKF